MVNDTIKRNNEKIFASEVKKGLKMDSAGIYESILANAQADLLPDGYARSGKSALFYRFSADQKVGCCIEMQKSMWNSPGSYSFTFRALCVGVDELDEYYNPRLTVSALKTYLHYPSVAERIGIICRGRDYWWEITDDILENCTPEEYYKRFLKSDIQACAAYLNNLAKKKQMKYKKNAVSAD